MPTSMTHRVRAIPHVLQPPPPAHERVRHLDSWRDEADAQRACRAALEGASTTWVIACRLRPLDGMPGDSYTRAIAIPVRFASIEAAWADVDTLVGFRNAVVEWVVRHPAWQLVGFPFVYRMAWLAAGSDAFALHGHISLEQRFWEPVGHLGEHGELAA